MKTIKKTDKNNKGKITVKTQVTALKNKNLKTSWQRYVEKILLINKFAWSKQEASEKELWNIFTKCQWYSLG